MNIPTARSLTKLTRIFLFASAVASGGCQRVVRAQTKAPSVAPATLRSMYAIPRPDRLQPSKTALVLVDFQEEFFHGRLYVPDAPRAARNAAALLRWARSSGIHVTHVCQVATKWDSPLFAPGSKTVAFVPELGPTPGEVVVTKSAAGGFTRTNLDGILRAKDVDTLIVGGLMTHLAVDSTVRDGAVLGYHVIVASDATATRDLPATDGGPSVDALMVQRSALAALGDRFADVLSTKEIERLSMSSASNAR